MRLRKVVSYVYCGGYQTERKNNVQIARMTMKHMTLTRRGMESFSSHSQPQEMRSTKSPMLTVHVIHVKFASKNAPKYWGPSK